MKNKMKECKVDGCVLKCLAKGYCSKHYYQLKRHGKIRRTKYDKNYIIKYKDYAEIIIYDNGIKGFDVKEKCRCKIDLEDINKIKKFKWYARNDNYVRNCYGAYIHRIILDPPYNKYIDHINHNPLDNRKNNLRVVTNQQNHMNQKIRGYYYSKDKKWIAQITCNNTHHYLGRFNTEEEAKKARIEAEIKYFGEYRYKVN
jgi:hypothetical protein